MRGYNAFVKHASSTPDFEAWLQSRSRNGAGSPEFAALCQRLRQALEQADTAEASAQLGIVVVALQLLGNLGLDEETLSATILYGLAGESAGAEENVSPGVRVLLEGQVAAEKVWTLYAARGTHTRAEGLRRLLLAIVRDLRVVFILLARQ
ncbi:MAG TPA: HD domain-containing protein, partial [Tahibacter sp.]|nr:HD domain-containing protein [Tahibacter sp.]